jgi:glycosyltransferase involved in cell wall biosynthesis
METRQKKRLKGIYLVPDPLMMKPHFGPSEHIKAGLHELQKAFDIELFVLGGQQFSEAKPAAVSVTKGRATKSGFVGMLRDLKLLYKSNRKVTKFVNELHGKKIDFIYERGQYLDLRGLAIAKRLGIPHFYEVNWINYLGIRQFYKSWFNAAAKRIEEYSYKRSTLNFFIGTQHTLINVPVEKVCTIQNGIHQSLVERNLYHVNKIGNKVKVCYVANLMPHHKFEIFLDALKVAQISEQIELHLVGYNFEQFTGHLPANLEYVLHGPVNKDILPNVLESCNIGLVSGGPSYSSFMKLFEYAAFKMCIVCPDLENVRLMFDGSEIAYFETDNSVSLADQLGNLCLHRDKIAEFGEKVYLKVRQEYTWENIYNGVASQITQKTLRADRL